MNKNKILIIEDDNILCTGLALSLSSNCIEAIEAPTIRAAKEMLQAHSFDLILLDCNLPDGSGIDFCKWLRCTSNVPVIFLTVNDTEIEIVSAFRVGATDYVTKPFSVMVLRERIKAALRRTCGNFDAFLEGSFYFDFSSFEYKIDGIAVILSTVEQKILKLLVSNKNLIIPRERMIEAVWSLEGEFIDDNALTVAIKRLRAKIGSSAIRTVYGLGYMWMGSEN